MKATHCPGILIDGRTSHRTYFGVNQFTSQINDAQRKYERDINALITQIYGRNTGWAILSEINSAYSNSANSVIIARIMTLAEFRAFPAPMTHAKNEQHATPKGAPIPPDTGSASTIRGTGQGSGALITFDPVAMGPNGNMAKLWMNAGYSLIAWAPDEMLFHELTHAMRMLQGQWLPTTLGGSTRYPNVEEFAGVLITNIYLSEKGKTTFRRDHRLNPLPTHESSSQKFLRDKENLAHIKEYEKRHPSLFANIARVSQAAFNPIREYVFNRSKYL